MDKYKIGMLARAKAGHDLGEVYVIRGVDESYVYLTDGRLKPLEKPKKKKKKHIQLISKRYNIRFANDATIRRILKEWKKGAEK